jgi:hypothetical protein
MINDGKPICEHLYIDQKAARCRHPHRRHVAIECAICTDYTPSLDEPPLDDAERQRVEVWTRVMGYHRPVSAWNKGKQQEHRDRVQFREGAGHD